MDLLANHRLRVTARNEGRDALLREPLSALQGLALLRDMISATLDGAETIGDNERSTLYISIGSCQALLENLAVPVPTEAP